ncbi:hypothetical protein, partial [Aeromonas allosaccharophila]|uniref:hypothetical protein n=1 Tax=Aeromonas allosaccharophila TaxID=656 RepID=UPI0005B1EA38
DAAASFFIARRTPQQALQDVDSQTLSDELRAIPRSNSRHTARLQMRQRVARGCTVQKSAAQ